MKSIIKFLIALIVAVMLLVITVGCKTIQPINQVSNTEKNYSQKIDSLKQLIINQAIDNKMILPVATSHTNNKVFDSLVNAKVDEILSKLNISNQSGDNNFEIYYDLIKKQLEVNAKIGATKSETNTASKETDKSDKNDKIIEVPVDKPLAKWQLYLIYIGVGALVFVGFKVALFIRSKTV